MKKMNQQQFLLTPELNQRIFKHFTGMDDQYVQIIQKYHTIHLNNDYSEDYKNKSKLTTLDNVALLVKEKMDNAKAEIEKIKDEYTVMPEEKTYTLEEKTYNLTLWLSILPTSSIEELKVLHADNEANEDFMKVLKAELRTRSNSVAKSPGLDHFMLQLEHGVSDTRFKELDDLVKGFNFFTSTSRSGKYPSYITDSLANVKYRNINHDLALFPISEGAIFRPLFKI